MPQFSFAIAATYAAQVLGAGIMALLLYGFHRQYRKSYLKHWMLGWAALMAYSFANAIPSFAPSVEQLSPSHPLRLAATVLIGVSGYLQIGWFMFGVYEIVRRRPVRLADARRLLAGLAFVGAVVPFVLFEDATPRYFVRVGMHSAIAALASLVASIALWRSRTRREGIGFTILGAAFFFYSLEQLHYVAIGFVWLTAGMSREYIGSLGYIDFLLQSVLAIGMIACLLEDEREAAELASAEIEHLAYHDALTGLPNRPLFVDRLIVAVAQSGRAAQKLAVFFLDLDRFKDINDSLGHSVGDQLLKAVAERIRRCVREGDTVARFGGDEFTLLVPRIENF